MKIRLKLILIGSILSINSFAQLSWQSLSTGGGNTASNNFDIVYSIDKDASNNIYSCGVYHGTTTFGSASNYYSANRSAFITKKNTFGNAIWQYVPSCTGISSAYAITIDSDQNVLVCGQYSGSITFGSTTLTAGTGTNSVFVVKFNGNTGLPMWAIALKSAGNAGTADITATGIATYTDGSIYVGGSYIGSGLTFNLGTTYGSTTNGSATLVRDGFLLKLNTNGGSTWLQRTLGTNNSSGNYDKSIYDVTVDANGNPVVVGFFKSGKVTMYPGGTYVNNSNATGSVNDAFLASWTSSGADIGISRYGTQFDEDYLYGVELLADNNFAVCGQFNNSAVVNKIASTNRAITNTFSSTTTSYSAFYALDSDNLGNIYTTGIITRSTTFGTNVLTLSAQQQDIVIGKISASNSWDWVNNFGTTSTTLLNDIGRSISVISNNDLIVGGCFSSTINLGSFSAQAQGNGDFFQGRYANCSSTLNFTTQPSSISQCGNTPATLSTSANVASTYQWYKNGIAINGANSSTYNFTISFSDNGANFYCIAQEIGGCAFDTTNTITASLTNGFSINTQPLSQTLCSGNNLSLSVNATGTGLTYQWKKDGNTIINATNAIYLINNLNSGDAGSYTVDISTSNCGTIPSNSAVININTSTEINTQPVSVTSCAGSTVQLTVSAVGTNLTYQWQKNNVNLSGAVTSNISFPNSTVLTSGAYTVIITGTCNTLTSSIANVTVNPTTSINLNYSNQTLCETNSFNISPVVTGSNLTYQWYKDLNPISGANLNQFNIASLSQNDGGNYYLVANGTCGTATSSNTALTVKGLTHINIQPQTTTTCENNSSFIYVSASGVTLSYQWYKNGSSINNANGANIDVTNSPGEYFVEISNGCSSIHSDTVNVFVNLYPQIITQPINQITCEGNQVVLIVNAIGDNLTYQWVKDGYVVPNSNSAICTINNVSSNDDGNYYVTITNACGNVISSNVSVNILQSTNSNITETACNSYSLGGETFTTSGTHTVVIPNAAGCDSTITLNLTIENIDMNVTTNGITFTAATIPNATYQWYNCDSQTLVPNETQNTFTPTNSDNYAVIITNSNCSDTSVCQSVSTSGINELEMDAITVYPNPSTGLFSIQSNVNVDLTITNVLGENLMQLSNNSIYHLDLSKYENGIYFIKENSSNRTIRIVKQK